jgi:hypothetical protein
VLHAPLVLLLVLLVLLLVLLLLLVVVVVLLLLLLLLLLLRLYPTHAGEKWLTRMAAGIQGDNKRSKHRKNK